MALEHNASLWKLKQGDSFHVRHLKKVTEQAVTFFPAAECAVKSKLRCLYMPMLLSV